MKRTALTWSSWVLAAYGYFLAVLPWAITGEGVLTSQVAVLSAVAGACMIYGMTQDYDAMVRDSDWIRNRSGKITSILTLLAWMATIYLLLLGWAEKGQGHPNCDARFGALPGLGFFLFGRSIAKR